MLHNYHKKGENKSKFVSIEQFNKMTIDLEYDDIIIENAQACCDEIVDYCKNKKWDEYAKGWVVEMRRPNLKTKNRRYQSKVAAAIIHNKDHYRLTHLLEKGHLITNKIGGVGFAAPFPHIRPAFDKWSFSFYTDLKEKTGIEVNINK